MDTEEASAGPRFPLVCLLLFASGACALAFQVAWARELRLVFGATTAATGAVLAVFMGGLGLGSAILGRRADRHGNPLWLYGALVALVGAVGIVSPYLILVVRWLYIAVGGQTALGKMGATVVRLLFAVLAIGPPTFLMGGTLPAAAKVVTTREDLARRHLAVLYGVNTLGAVVGAWLCTFYMLEGLGTRSTLQLAGLVGVMVGLSGIALSRALPCRAAAASDARGKVYWFNVKWTNVDQELVSGSPAASQDFLQA
jgi:hypothetical protein